MNIDPVSYKSSGIMLGDEQTICRYVTLCGPLRSISIKNYILLDKINARIDIQFMLFLRLFSRSSTPLIIKHLPSKHSRPVSSFLFFCARAGWGTSSGFFENNTKSITELSGCWMSQSGQVVSQPSPALPGTFARIIGIPITKPKPYYWAQVFVAANTFPTSKR